VDDRYAPDFSACFRNHGLVCSSKAATSMPSLKA
jgi:hypothetical protein